MKKEDHFIVVNIPSASLILYEKGKPILESRIVVGKKSTPTPTLSSKIDQVILYPYWNVPNKIAAKELLPMIKRYPKFLEENNYQVLNKEGKLVDADSVSWKQLSRYNFPYQLRQSTGCDNSLGIIKLNFYNPFSVYLHDTPWKYFFSLNKRYFSHGCMRVEKAVELARYVIRGNTTTLDTLVDKGCVENQQPQTIAATEAIPVFVVYHTAWTDAHGRLSFHEDIYNRMGTVKK
jgi:murein L,D-transpeptidase YcbB/YkuD